MATIATDGKETPCTEKAIEDMKHKIQPINPVLLLIFILTGIVLFGIVGLLFINQNDNVLPDTSNAVVSRVANLPEVQEFQQAVEANGRSTFSITIDSYPTEQEPYYTIQVSEFFPDHRTTFNWYRVDKATDDVSKLDIATDTWEQVEQ